MTYGFCRKPRIVGLTFLVSGRKTVVFITAQFLFQRHSCDSETRIVDQVKSWLQNRNTN